MSMSWDLRSVWSACRWEVRIYRTIYGTVSGDVMSCHAMLRGNLRGAKGDGWMGEGRGRWGYSRYLQHSIQQMLVIWPVL